MHVYIYSRKLHKETSHTKEKIKRDHGPQRPALDLPLVGDEHLCNSGGKSRFLNAKYIGLLKNPFSNVEICINLYVRKRLNMKTHLLATERLKSPAGLLFSQPLRFSSPLSSSSEWLELVSATRTFAAPTNAICDFFGSFNRA